MSVIDYKHLQELFNGVPSMKENSSFRVIQTVSGEQLPIVGTVTVTYRAVLVWNEISFEPMEPS